MHEEQDNVLLMKEKIDISVVLSAHNSEKTLGLAVRSTLHALPKTGELLVCLHNCSDKSSDVLQSIYDSRLKVFTLKEGGFSDALNYLVSKARGRWIARMDADDVCLPWRFQHQSRFIAKHPEIDAMFSTAIIFGEAIRPLYIFPQYTTCLDSAKFKFMLTQGNPAVHPTLYARAELLQRVRYRDVPGEDLDLWLRIAVNGGRFARSRLPVLLYRSHKRQMSRQRVYLEGWRNSLDIQHNRLELSNSRLNETLLNNRLGFAIRHPLLVLEIIGFPSLRKIIRWISQQESN